MATDCEVVYNDGAEDDPIPNLNLRQNRVLGMACLPLSLSPLTIA